MGKFGTEAVLIATSIVGLAVIAVIVSKKADTANILTQAGNALSNTIGAAVKPITG
jgi:PRD1 phage membrane DNA delivery